MGDIYKLVCHFVCNTSDWKDSFFQTEYVKTDVLGTGGTCLIRNVCSILNLFAGANLVTKSCKTRKRVQGWFVPTLSTSTLYLKVPEIIDSEFHFH